mgnify:CR=1 FL=1
MLADSNTSKIFGFADYGISTDSLAEKSPDYGLSPYDKVQASIFKKQLAIEIAGLPEKERLVMVMYYDEEINFKEVGAVLGVSESRISQLHSQALYRLKARMQAWRID